MGDVFEQTANFVNPNDDDIELWSLTVEDGLTPKSERYNREFLVKKKTNFKEVRPGDIVYNPMNMTLGAVGFNGMAKSVAVSGYYTTMVANKGYDSYYINTWLKSPQAISLYKTFATGSLKEKQRVQFPTLSIIPATFPEHDEQTKIGSYFEHLDHLITLHHRKYMKYADLSVFDWEQRKLSELSEKTFGGGTPKTSNESFWKGNIPWIQSSDLIEGSLFDIEPRKYISQEAVDKSATKLVPENSVAIVTRVGVGKLAFMPFSYATSQDFLSLSVLKTEPQFTVYALYKKLQSELNAVQGTSIKGVTKNELLAKEIMIPCYEEQEKIGSYLHSLDHLITLHQRKCEETKTLKKYMLQKMFPQNGHSVPEIRFSGFTEDWEQRKFGEIVQKYEDPVETPAEGYMRLGIRSHAKGTFHSYVEKGKELETAKMFRVAANNFIVNITFGWEHAVAITDESDAGKLVSHRFPQYSFKEGMNPRFFKYLILDECFRHHLELSSPGGAGRNRVLKLNEMLEYKMKFPQMEEQEEIAIYFEQLDNLITLHHRKQNYVLNTLIYAKTTLFITKTS